MKKFTLVLAISGLLTSPTFADTCTSKGDGDWSDPATWTCGHAPSDGDVIVIDAGHTIDVDCNCGEYVNMRIEVYGDLHFNNGKKINLDADGVVQIYAGGVMTGGNGGSKLIIDGTTMWDGNDADVPGPAYFDAGGGPTPGVLPVILAEFTAELNSNNEVQLYWVTAAEQDNDYFMVQRSINGYTFEDLDQVDGFGTSSSEIEYDYLDTDPIEGIAYYRLKQFDYDGQSEVHKVIAVDFSQEGEECVLKVYPNPCPGNCSVELGECDLNNEEVSMEVYDMAGNLVAMDAKYPDSERSATFQVNTNNNLSPGIYIIKTSTNGKNYSTKGMMRGTGNTSNAGNYKSRL